MKMKKVRTIRRAFVFLVILLITNGLTFILSSSKNQENQKVSEVGIKANTEIENVKQNKPVHTASFKIDPAKVQDIEYVVIIAHPDDETLWAGNFITKEKCLVLCITNGNNAVRRDEFLRVMKETNNYGIILNYPDNPNKIRSTWKKEKTAIQNDIEYLIGYKPWTKIITHNPEGEYGHIHHRSTSMMVTNICTRNKIENRLYYFEKYMKSNKVVTLPATLAAEQIQHKHYLMQLYPSQINAYYKFQHMMSFEELIPYDEWYFG